MNFLTEKQESLLQNGSVTQIKRILNKRNVNYKSRRGEWTPLIYCCWKRRDKELLDFLLSIGADPKLTSSSGCTALHYLCDVPYEDSSFVETLISKGANVNQANTMKWTPLHCACGSQNKFPNAEIIKILISNGADLSCKTESGWTALHLICELPKPNAEIVKALLENGANVNVTTEDGWSVVHFLAEPRDDPRNRTSTCKALRLVVNHGANVNFLNTDGFSAFHLLSVPEKGKIDLEILRNLINTKASLNLRKNGKKNGETPLYLLCHNETIDFDACKLMIRNGADLNIKCKNGNTPLHGLMETMTKIDSQWIEFLIENGADFEIKNEHKTPLDKSIKKNKRKIKRLIKKYSITSIQTLRKLRILLKKQLKENKIELTKVQKKVDSHNKETTAYLLQLQKYKNEIKQQHKQLQLKDVKIQVLSKRIEQKMGENEFINIEIQEYQKEKNKLSDSLNIKIGKYKEVIGKNKALVKRVKLLTHKNKVLKNDNKDDLKEIQKLKSNLDKRNNEINSYIQKLDDKDKYITEIEEKTNILSLTKNRLIKRVTQKEKNNIELKKKLQQEQEENFNHCEDIDNLSQKIIKLQDIENKNNLLENQLKETAEKLIEKNEDLLFKEKEIENKDQITNVLKKQLNKLQTKNEKLNTILLKEKKNNEIINQMKIDKKKNDKLVLDLTDQNNKMKNTNNQYREELNNLKSNLYKINLKNTEREKKLVNGIQEKRKSITQLNHRKFINTNRKNKNNYNNTYNINKYDDDDDSKEELNDNMNFKKETNKEIKTERDKIEKIDILYKKLKEKFHNQKILIKEYKKREIQNLESSKNLGQKLINIIQRTQTIDTNSLPIKTKLEKNKKQVVEQQLRIIKLEKKKNKYKKKSYKFKKNIEKLDHTNLQLIIKINILLKQLAINNPTYKNIIFQQQDINSILNLRFLNKDQKSKLTDIH
ncbi:ankyrin repeat-containing protein [Anaeramoeba flamelloides]|uniref:Ankyrin repeat-containing protein n=1 Tax=Anaeramoeba flamelloides TaxID=1746091 RepID=A0AAV8A937_9EUKA|nr:ankyrin repeat-containing protein [Anaeramoeba flamelloides]